MTVDIIIAIIYLLGPYRGGEFRQVFRDGKNLMAYLRAKRREKWKRLKNNNNSDKK